MMSKQPSIWARRIADHAMWDQLDVVGERSLRAADVEDDEGDRIWTERHSRVERVLDATRRRVQQADPELVPVHTLDGLKTALEQAAGQLDSFLTNENAAHLDKADTHIDEVLEAASNLPPLPVEVEAEVVRRAVGSLREELATAVASGEAQVRELEARAASVREAHAAELRARDERLEELQQTNEREHAERDERARALQLEVDATREALESTKTDLAEAEQTERARWKAEADRLLSELGGLRDQASALVQEKAAEVVSGGYASLAKDQREQADTWRWWAIGFATSGVLLAVVVLFWGDATGTVAGAARSGTAVAGLFGIAGYAGKQSSSHRHRERAAYKSTMELAALEPFLANLPDDEKAAARRVFAEHFFSQPLEVEVLAAADEPVSAKQMLTVLRELGALPKK